MEGVKESLSLEQSERAAGERDELKRLTTQVELERLTNYPMVEMMNYPRLEMIQYHRVEMESFTNYPRVVSSTTTAANNGC